MNWRKIFNWTPVTVKVPYPRFSIRGNKRFLLGYVVEIEYKYHGLWPVFFEAHNNLNNPTQRGSAALRDAIILYKRTKNTIYENNNKNKQK